MKPPFAYYGGKQNLVPDLLPLIPRHVQYCEIFAGGLALFFAKKPSKNEVINDLNGNITNFYMMVKTRFDELQKLVQGTLHSEIIHQQTADILYKEDEDPIVRAWALWVQANCSFGHILDGGFAFGTTGSGLSTANKRDGFTKRFSDRFRSTEIFNRSAHDLLTLKDHPETFFYIDPPYVSSDCGSYKGYTMEHFKELLDILKTIKGKFLLSSYPEDILMDYRKEMGWNTRDLTQVVLVSGKREETKYKTECLTWNYPTPSHQNSLFTTHIEKATQDEDSLYSTSHIG